ncbi:flagellar basal body rod protein FlgB [Caproiciproducens faecalis]|uniref:Flagellar basal body rod protein FlgB n=1 Tax=Caproiciproducens faecalis TaxID=2820301 RepID=A0ABS7DPV5_9FIRM|nr:flagellar basal body rod protein FlgB [Caproiciproducens faecalis]MBW7573345.1 flagellar basal body rod protein FlgB [Caproiciproducens faecalis]
MDWFNSVSATLLNKDLDGLWMRQREISDNISNIETPGYKSRSVSFEDQLKQLMSVDNTDSTALIEQIRDAAPQITVSNDESMRLDGNNVDAEKENIELARTQINYNYSLRELSDYFSRLRYAITDGKA